MTRPIALALPLLVALLSACGSSTPPTPSTPSLSQENAYGGAAPASAQMLTPEEFQRRLDAGELTLLKATDASTRRSFTATQLASDLAGLSAFPEKSEVLQNLLATAPDAQPTPEGDLLIHPIGNDGKSLTILTLGRGVEAHALLSADQASRDPANALEVYRTTYNLLTPAQQAGLSTPDALAGRPIAELQAALAALDDTLGEVPDLDQVRPEGPGASVGQAIGSQSVVLKEAQQPGAGNGSDNSGPCPAPSAGGIFSRLRWPLKGYVSPIKDQGQRGTCWDFASVGALESRVLVTSGTTVDLSEQHFNNLRKLNTGDSDEGDFPREALNDLTGRGVRIGFESAWTYNPSNSRRKTKDGNDDGQADVCKDYTGLCSENTHQNPLSCTTFIFTFCGNEQVAYTGASPQKAVTSSVVWDNTSGKTPLPLNTIRTLLNGGQELILSFDVTAGFSGVGSSGYIVKNLGASQGGHAVQVIGFVPDSLASFTPTPQGGSGGGWFVIKNSWSCNWGDAGYAYMPVTYLQTHGWELDALSTPSTRSAAFAATRDALGGAPQPVPAVSSVTLSTPPTLDVMQGGSVDIRAVVNGLGAIDPNVTWTLDLPNGTLSRSRGTSVRYTASSLVTEGNYLVLTAAAVSDPSKTASVTITLHEPARGRITVSSVASDAGTFLNPTVGVIIPIKKVVTVAATLLSDDQGIDHVELRLGVPATSQLLNTVTLSPLLGARQSGPVSVSGDLSGAPTGNTFLFLRAYSRSGAVVANSNLLFANVLSTAPALPMIGDPSPASLNLTAPVNGFATASVTYGNPGSGSLSADANPGSGWLTVVSNTPKPLAPGATATVSLRATCPATPGPLSTTLIITANDTRIPSKTVNVSLNCTAPSPVTTLGLSVTSVGSQSVPPFGTTTNPVVVSGTVNVRGYVQAGANPVTKVQAFLVGNPVAVGEKVVSVAAGVRQDNVTQADLDTTALPNGSYSFFVRAVDSTGAGADSSPVTVMVNNATAATAEIRQIGATPVSPGQDPLIVRGTVNVTARMNGGATGYNGDLYLCLIGTPKNGSTIYPVGTQGVSINIQPGAVYDFGYTWNTVNTPNTVPTAASTSDKLYMSHAPDCLSNSYPGVTPIRVIVNN